MLNNFTELDMYLNALLDPDVKIDFSQASREHHWVGERILLELDLGGPFFDVFEDALGFEQAIYYFAEEDPVKLQCYFEMYLQQKLNMISQAVSQTNFESFFSGCRASHLSLLGAKLWRRWEKPLLKRMTEEVHKHGRLIHHHFHGKCMAVLNDLVEIGFDCICPFERPPGDVEGREGLVKIRETLNEQVTFNGNIHTIETMIKGSKDDVRRDVQEIRTVFSNSRRLIIGTGSGRG